MNHEFNDNDYGETEDAEECQALCQKTALCQWFDWDSKNKCYLKTAKGNKSRGEPGAATGPGFCLGK